MNRPAPRPAWLAVVNFLILGAVLAPVAPEARPPGPRTANVYVRNHYEPGDAEILSRYDVVAIDADTPPATIQAIRSYGTGTKILAFIPANGTYESALLFPDGSIWREIYEAAETHNWWLRDTEGENINDHGAKFTTNITTACPPNSLGQTILDWFPTFVVHTLLDNGVGLWDGVFLDDCWIAINWVTIDTLLNPNPIDADNNGVADPPAVLDAWYKAGTDTLVSRIRRMLPPEMIVMGNGQNQFYSMNGAMIENFPFTGYPDPGCPYGYSWSWDMFGTYGYFNNSNLYNASPQQLNIINSKWIWGSRYAPTPSADFDRFKQFTLASCMLRDGYYALDWYDLPGTKKQHHSLWWEPEFDKPFGDPLGPPYQLTRNGVTIWRRDFDGGSVVVNPSNVYFPASVPDSLPIIGAREGKLILDGEFYKPDLVPPARVTDLRIVQVWADSVELEWTNSGDDGMEGEAVGLTIRSAAGFAMTDANFTSGKRLLPAVPPDVAGTVQRTRIRGLIPGTLYYFALRHADENGNVAPVSSNASIVVGAGVSGVPGGAPPARPTLGVPVPNPFRGPVRVALTGPAAGVADLSVDVVDPLGRRVRRLHEGAWSGAPTELVWDGLDDGGREQPGGAYFLVMRDGARSEVRKIVRTR